eukprot:jgi/Tetstr1/454359/TSEL_041266.t1
MGVSTVADGPVASSTPHGMLGYGKKAALSVAAALARPPPSPYVRRYFKPIVSNVQRNKVVSLPLAGTAASPKLHGLVGVLAQQQKREGGIIKHNINAVKNLAATQAVSGDNVDEGSSPEPPAKKAKQPAKPAAGGPALGR